MKSLRILSFLALVLVVVPLVSAADFGIRAGRYNDSDEEFVGAEALFDIGAININPNVEYLLTDEDITAGTANIDVTVDLATFSSVTPYLGAGVGLWYADDDFGGAETEPVGNLIGGIAFNFEFLKPYAQVKYFRLFEDEGEDNDELAFTVGLRF